MSTRRWYFYDLATGLLSGRALSGPEEMLDDNTPAGHGALEVPPGTVLDPRNRRVDLASGELVPWQPPAPPDDERRTWTWDPVAERYVALPTLAATKLERWALIKRARDLTEFGGFTWDGVRFDSDEQAQARIMGAVQMAVLAVGAGQPFAIDWTLEDNTVRQLTAAEMVAVGLALGTHVGTAHATARQLRQALDEAETPEAIEAVAWPE